MTDIVRQSERLAGEIAMDLFEHFWAKDGFRAAGGKYEPLCTEDFERLGFPTDDPYLTILRSEPDGQLFEIEIEVFARAVEPPQPEREEIPGQGALPMEVAQ